MFAARNISLCTKDCVCLFVCPTGATDTENGRIDAEKCIDGCRLCVDACPSHAIYLVCERLPRVKSSPSDRIVDVFSGILRSKAGLCHQAAVLADSADAETTAGFWRAFQHSNQVLAEDCARESGCLYPERGNIKELLGFGLLKKLYEQRFPDTEGLDKAITSILVALDLNKDCGDRKLSVCTECGYLSEEPMEKGCPQCSSDQIEVF